MPRPLLAVAVPLCALLVLTGCTTGEQPAPTTPPPASAPAASPAAADRAGVEHDVEYGGARMTALVGPVRSDGEVALLPVQVSVAADAPPEFYFMPKIAFSSAGTPGLGALLALDLPAGLALPPGRDEAGRTLGAGEHTRVRAGQSQPYEVLIPAPDGETVDVLLPIFGLVRDVPVVDGAVPDPSTLGAEGLVTFAEQPLEVFVNAYDDASSASADGEAATVTLGSDVLFATDESTLTDGAAQVVDQAAAQIAASGAGGEVTVVGHTDDQASDDYNLQLSRERAASVAERLTGSLGSQSELTVDGKGESEPVAEGTDAEARAANRRVEIRFTVTSQEALLEAAGAPVPEPTGSVASGAGTVEISHLDTVSSVRVVSVQRVEGYLVGELEITRVSGGGSTTPGLLEGAGVNLNKRGISISAEIASAAHVSLLTPAGRVHPLDHLVPGQERSRRIVGESNVIGPLDDGTSMRATVVWPDTRQDTVDIDVPGRFRITDVPVVAGR